MYMPGERVAVFMFEEAHHLTDYLRMGQEMVPMP